MTENIISSLLHDDYAVIFAPALEQDISDTNLFLQKHNRGTLPPDYLHLLRQSDGLSYNGIELFGTSTHPRPQQGYNFPNLIRVNSTYLKYDFFQKKIVFGRLSEAVLFYNQKIESYTLADRINLRSRFETKNFADFMSVLQNLC